MVSAIIVPANAPLVSTGVTLLRLRNRLADELGFYQPATVTSTGAGDAKRVVIADELRDDEAGYDFMGQPWVYARTGDQAGNQRRMLAQPEIGYQGNMAALVLSRPYAASLAAGTTIEITSPLPVKRHLGIKGLNECINEGLSRIWIEVRVPIVGNGTYEYSTDAYPWLKRYEQLRGIYDFRRYGTTAPTELSSYGYRIVTTGATRTLVTTALYSTAETFYLAAIVRADRCVSDGTTWAYVNTPGLLNDAYEAAIPEEWGVAFGMVIALRFLIEWVERDEKISDAVRNRRLANFSRRLAQWASAAASIKLNEFAKPLQEPTEGLVYAIPGPVWT